MWILWGEKTAILRFSDSTILKNLGNCEGSNNSAILRFCDLGIAESKNCTITESQNLRIANSPNRRIRVDARRVEGPEMSRVFPFSAANFVFLSLSPRER